MRGAAIGLYRTLYVSLRSFALVRSLHMAFFLTFIFLQLHNSILRVAVTSATAYGLFSVGMDASVFLRVMISTMPYGPG